MIGPEKILLAILLTMLAISLGLLLFVEVDFETTRSIAIGVCIALVSLLGIGVIFPVRRYLRQQKARRQKMQGEQD